MTEAEQRVIKNTPFLAEVKNVLAVNGEAFVEIYYPSTGGITDYLFVHTLTQFEALLRVLPLNSGVAVYRHKQLPLRGIASDELLDQALTQIPDGLDWFMLNSASSDPKVFDQDGDLPISFWWLWRSGGRREGFSRSGGSTHEKLRNEFEQVRGQAVALGFDFPIPHSSSRDEVIEEGVDELVDTT